MTGLQVTHDPAKQYYDALLNKKVYQLIEEK